MAEVYQGKMVLSREGGGFGGVGHCGDGLSMGMEGEGVNQAGLSLRLRAFPWERRIGLAQPAFCYPGCLAMGGHLLCREVKRVWTLRSGCLKHEK